MRQCAKKTPAQGHGRNHDPAGGEEISSTLAFGWRSVKKPARRAQPTILSSAMADAPPDAISADFPFESRYAAVDGVRLHYVDEGSGPPVLFLHGSPTWSYIWRNVIPHLSSRFRCVALDLAGMGMSEKPDIEYRFFDHARYVEGFIDSLGLARSRPGHARLGLESSASTTRGAPNPTSAPPRCWALCSCPSPRGATSPTTSARLCGRGAATPAGR